MSYFNLLNKIIHFIHPELLSLYNSIKLYM